MVQFDEVAIQRIEAEYPRGLTSAQILELCAGHGIVFSEACLRKYVQLGLLPRSVRVGKKGKHQGSLGVYPVRVIRQIGWLRQLMAEELTIEQIQQGYALIHGDIEQLEDCLDGLFGKLEQRMGRRPRPVEASGMAHRVLEAKGKGRDLLASLRSIETQLSRPRTLLGAVAS